MGMTDNQFKTHIKFVIRDVKDIKESTAGVGTPDEQKIIAKKIEDLLEILQTSLED
ncbi:MAG: hypothetical protein FWB71_01150 [Defluviitaleaceae bacterium]|nr:hypothetical protein [Defluviitaleaceae bacterium]